ncbi:MAG TPA: fumarate hydratase [Clostridiales bacterium]|nr:fumarate hydratase [Clostridiales bacterium]
MRTITYEEIKNTVAALCVESCNHLGEDVLQKLKSSVHTEKSPVGVDILKQLVKNALIAAADEIPICQDCGLAVVFAEVGQEVHIEGSFTEAVNDGVIQGYAEGYLRKSTCTALTRENYGNNAPAILHTKLVPGENIKLTVAPKGGGAENMSVLKMFPPAAGRDGIIDFVVDTVGQAGPNPCPPIILGIGIGGNFEMAPLLAKEALLLEIEEKNGDPTFAAMEEEILKRCNQLGIGPGGLGGSTTVLAVHIKDAPCHIASLPCAVNINCHAARHKTKVI